MSSTERKENPIPPWNRMAVNAVTAAQMMGCGKSTFFRRVKDKVYPPPARDGLWNVSELRLCRERLSALPTPVVHQASQPTTA